MAAIHKCFRDCMSVAIESYGLNYGEFCRLTGYRDFRLDLEDMSDARVIAGQAIATLCNGSRGSMDEAVASAVCEFLVREIGVVCYEQRILMELPCTFDHAVALFGGSTTD